MLSELWTAFAYAVGYRILFGAVLLSISSACLGIHFYLGNSFSVIQEWFEVYFVEVITISVIFMLAVRRYLGFGLEYGEESPKIRNSDPLLLINYFVIVFFTLIYLKPEISLDTLRHSIFFTIYILVDFFNAENNLTRKIISLRARFSYCLFHICLSFLTFFIFFGFNHKFSYLYTIFLAGFFVSREILDWRAKRIIRFYGPLVGYFIFCLNSNLFFPVDEMQIFYFTLLFFGFNLVTFIWHRSFYKNN